MSNSKISTTIINQVPKFILESCGGTEENGGAFSNFLKYYYESQEKLGASQDLALNLLSYLDIDQLNTKVLDGTTFLLESVGPNDTEIVVESVENFLEENGTFLLGNEVITYESTTSSPNISFSPGISYEQVKLKWTNLAGITDLFDGARKSFPLISQEKPISVPSDCHIIVTLYGDVLTPGADYSVEDTNIVFSEAPRVKLPSDDDTSTSIIFLNGFSENTIREIDDISSGFGDGRTLFNLTSQSNSYSPVAAEFLLVVYDNRLLIPNVDFYINNDEFIMKTAPSAGRNMHICAIEAPIPTFGSGASGFARVNNNGQLVSINVSETGSDYRFEYAPTISINSDGDCKGTGGSAVALINGVKQVNLLDGGIGYSDTNPPIVIVEPPTKPGAKPAQITAQVTNGSVSSLRLISSGSGYTFTPRITFKQPGGAKLGPIQILNGSVVGPIEILDPGFGYTTPPKVYIDAATGINGINASLEAVLTDGKVTSINILNAGQGYEQIPRAAIVDPVGAQVLEVNVDGTGRVTNIELLDGGSGYIDVPSVYIVDNRPNGGTGATAVASIFNGRITDINITSFGSGYSAANPPTIIIQSPSQARAACSIGLNEVTGFSVTKRGSGYCKAKFTGCARGASAITSFTESGNAVFTNETEPTSHAVGSNMKCLDSVFLEQILGKYKSQFLPNIPELDFRKIDIRTAFKTIKDFYSAKGTSFSIAYLFKLLYGESVSISYPKDQIIKPSAATWSIDTILRATLISGDPSNIKDGLLQQFEDIADPNVRAASALVENFISIKTSDQEIFELVLSEETITGRFTVPYKTKLAESLTADTSIITVDSTIGWPERNGELVIGDSEVVRYKEKSLNQFIECTRSINGIVEDWDAATEVSSNFKVYINYGTPQEVVLNILGIVDAQQTILTDTGSYYLTGDKLSVSKLGGTGEDPQLKTWLYNVKKLVEVSSITFGGINNRSATVTCNNPHGLLVGDQVTVYGANPILFNGTFLVTSRDSETVFQYQLPQPAVIEPQGNILISVDLNKGKSDNQAVQNAIGPYTTNVQNAFFNEEYVYVASTGIPNYKIGPFPESALLPGNQRKLNRFPFNPVTISAKNTINPGPIGTWVNGVSVWSYKSPKTKLFGEVTSVSILNAGRDYDAASPPTITISGGGGIGAEAFVEVDGSISEIEVLDGGSGYTSSPLVSIVGGGGSGASASAIITKGVVSRILINSGGSGYTTKPTITIVGGGGIGATAEASVRGPIKSINITDGGSSYISNPTVTLSSGSGAVAQAIVNDGRIISIAIIDAGSGYTTAPEVFIGGVGFGAVAKANIDTDGENAGRVTSIEILNKGIGYTQGTTQITLSSIGEGAQFEAKVFEWKYNVARITDVDAAFGYVFEGYNTQYGGEYAHFSNPQKLRYILGDNLFEDNQGNILEKDESLEHSPIIGWAFDGNPIYGPYGYQDPTNQSSSIVRMRSSYALKSNLVYDQITNPVPERISGPLLVDDPAGTYIDDYEYQFNLGDLDQYNGRFCKTPEFPTGRYCYFTTIDATEQGNPVFPYIIGPEFNSVVDKWNLVDDAVQQNIPTGVIRYRDPYENVDIDVERNPNASTNGLTTEDGDLLLFEVEDENRDGIITQDELDDPDQIFEEPPLQLYDYFPKVKLDSKVDIEVDTITKFKDASVTGFKIENPGRNYQVNDKLIFNNDGTDGSGVSARISKILGEEVTSYTFENISGESYGVLTTAVPHNLVPGDTVFIDYEPIMDNTNKTFVVRQYRGIEEIVIDQIGSGYNTDILPSILIDGDGEDAALSAVIDSVGAISSVNILNSGSGYTKNPRIILSHPQIFKKADYYISSIENNDFTKVNDISVNESKESYICGVTKKVTGENIAFVAKLSATGVREWQKTLESTSGLDYAEFTNIFVSGKSIWLVGITKPNVQVLDSYNPDIIICKYQESENGLDSTLIFQKGYAGISGSTRADVATSIKQYSDTRFIVSGYTNTNSGNPYDAFLALIDLSGNFSIKRKLASANRSEKITDFVVLDQEIYFVMEVANNSSDTNVNLAVGKAVVGTSAIEVSWIKEISSSAYAMVNPSISIDEFNEIYICCGNYLKSNVSSKDGITIVKVDTDGDVLWSKRYAAPSGYSEVEVVGSNVIDIFGDIKVAYNCINTVQNNRKEVHVLEIFYTGEVKNSYSTYFNENLSNSVEGLVVNSIDSDVSGDLFIAGQSYYNANEFLLEFSGTDDLSDSAEHFTPVGFGIDATESLTISGDGIAKIYGRDVSTPSNWENAAIKFPAADLGSKLDGDWTIEFMLYHDSSVSDTHSQTEQTLFAVGDATDSTGGIWLYYDRTDIGPSGKLKLLVANNTTTLNTSSSVLATVQTNLFADDTWQFVGLKKEDDQFTIYVNGIQVATGSISNVTLANKDLYIGNIPGRDGVAGSFRSNEQGQYYIDNLKLKNYPHTPTVPSDVVTIPSNGNFPLAYNWVDDAWFEEYVQRYEYLQHEGFVSKYDRYAKSPYVGTGSFANTNLNVGISDINLTSGSDIILNTAGFSLGNSGLQSLDYDDATTTLSQNTNTLVFSNDIRGSKTATVPSPGSRKLKITAVVKDRYFFKVNNVVKIDNIKELTINRSFKFTVGSNLILKNDSGQFLNSGYIISVDTENNKVLTAVNNNLWDTHIGTGSLSTETFNELETYGIVGPAPNDVNEITQYVFPQVDNTTPGTFDIALVDYNHPDGLGTLDQFAKFKPFISDEYAVRIDEISGSSPYIVGSLISITSNDISYNSTYTETTITNLTGVTKISLITNLIKILNVESVQNSDKVYVITDTKHYLNEKDIFYVDGNPTQTVGNVVYDEYNGTFPVDSVVSPLEFTYKLIQPPITEPSSNAGSVNLFIKSPTLKMYYGHQYLFDLSHSSMANSNLSFSKDNLYKLEYSFNSIERIGTPGVTGEGQPTPTVKFKVDNNIVTNISYYFDPSRPDPENSPVNPGSYLDVVNSPYVGQFNITSIGGETITTGAKVFKFPLQNEPEGDADISQTSYSTSSLKAVGSIADIRIVNPGGFYTRLPIVSGIESTRQIERVQINEPGTEYAPGTYSEIPIQGDGEGGLVQITVDDGTDDEGVLIPGQIQKIVVTSPGKNYTTAFIDIEAIPGILGPGLTGSGAEVEVIIPPFGTDASIFTSGENVGKIKNLKNNNFGYDYPHDYTLRPEITFPINAQLISTSILDSITVDDPGSGYSQAPAVIISGGGGSGAIAEATIKNGRLDQIIVKDPGAGYSSEPSVELKSSFNYVVNLDLGILQFAFPHGIANGSEVTLNVVDTGDGKEFPLSAGALGRLNGTTTYYAITGTQNSLDDDQLRLAITPQNAELGDYINFVNAGVGRQQLLTSSFGGSATANVVTSTFLQGELLYQGDSLETATATGYVSTNNGWQVGPRIVKIVGYDGEFVVGQRITGVVSKSSGIISDLKIARGVLEIGSITKTTGQFIDDVGKPSEIIQKIQDSYYYQDFSYAVKSSVSIRDWKEILLRNVHPAGFKIFGELSFNEYAFISNKETSFQLTKSVQLAQETVLPNIQNFALVEPIYSEFNNTEVLFRQKRLTSSENILTSVVQRLDDISDLFDGERIAFPITVNGNTVVANETQLMIILNGVVQNPRQSFVIQGDSIVFSEPPQPPASVKYVNVVIEQIPISETTFTNISGIFPLVGNEVLGTESQAKLKVTGIQGNSILGYVTQGTFINGELCSVGATGFTANFESITPIDNIGLFSFGEQVTNFAGDTAKVEQINLETGQERPIAKLRYTIGVSTNSFEVIDANGTQDQPVPQDTFIIGNNYQFGSEIFTVTGVTDGSDSTTITVLRGQLATVSQAQQQDTPIYGTEIKVNNNLTLSKTAGTYKSTPGLFNINVDDVIIAAQSGVVAKIVSANTYSDPVTGEFIPQVNISEGSSFFGLLFNRIASTTYPNVVIDDISKSTVNVVRFDDNDTSFNANFPANEGISNYVITYDNQTGEFVENEYIRNYQIEYGNNNKELLLGETALIRKLAFRDRRGSGFFSIGQVIRTRDTKAEVIGYNQSANILYLGKIGRCKSTGEDYHNVVFANSSQIDTGFKKFGNSSLLLTKTSQDYISVASSSEFGFGTNAYTIEMYIRPTADALTGSATIIDFRDTVSDATTGVLYLSGGQIRYDASGANVVNSGLVTLSADIWYHVAIQRSGTGTNGVTLLIDGSQAGQGTDTTNYPTKGLRIGNDAAAATGFDGNIDELRISTVIRYSSIPFSPRAGIFQGDGNEVLLLHFEGPDQSTITYDWSGSESFTNGDQFANDSIIDTNALNGIVGFDGKSHRYLDAADLIIANKEYLAKEVVDLVYQKFPYFTVPGGDINCEDDIRDIIDSLVDDLRNGGNSSMWDAASLYVNRDNNPATLNHIETEIKESIYAYDKLKEIIKYVINNELWSTKGNHGLNQVTNAGITDSTTNSFTTLTPTDATYDSSTGDMVITVAGHGLEGPTTYTPTGAVYDPSSGIMTLTIANHGFVSGDKIQIAEESLSFTCAMDGYTSTKVYPRSSDPGALGWLEISNITTNTFDVNVGASNLEYYIVSDATYDPSTGIAVLTIGDHTLRPGTSIKLQNESLTFTCATDGNASEHSYPRPGDGNYDTAITIINNGTSHTPSNVSYLAQSGETTITINNHGLSVGDQIRIEDNSLTFTCSQDGYNSEHTYPRSTDYASGRWLRISSVTTNTFTVNTGNAGAASQYAHTFVSAAADAITFRDQTITINVGVSTDVSEHTFVRDELVGGNGSVVAGGNYAHNFVSADSDSITKKGDSITIATESITFTCDSDGNNRPLSHPRSSDPVYNSVIDIKSHTTDTFTVYVGESPENSQYTHTFVSADADAITVVDYNTLDCADVYATASSLVEILTDTLREAYSPNLSPDGDHLGTVTRIAPAYEFIGGLVDSYYEVPFAVDFSDDSNDIIYTNQIDSDSRNRYYDAANLIRANRGAIVDKASADLLAKYPDLVQDMPRNANGGSTSGTDRCKTDLGLLLDALANDIEDGGNANVVRGAKFYVSPEGRLNHIRLQVFQSVYAHERLALYAKQAITGDLTYDNTNNIIVGDWGITNDPGNCADVQSAIDTLVQTINDIIAPTNADFAIGADRLYFNRKYIREEVTGIISSHYGYDLNGIQYSAFDYPNGFNGEIQYQNDFEFILLSMISDLQTGGNNSTIEAIETYLTANLQLNRSQDEILPIVYGISQIKFLGEKALEKRLYEFNSGFTDPDYSARFTDEEPYEDFENPTNISDVVYRFRELCDIAINILLPGKESSQNASTHILYNQNYYKEELAQSVTEQFGSETWNYDSFIDTLIDSNIYDLVTTDVTDKSTAYYITFSSVGSEEILVGSTLYLDGGAPGTADNSYATVYEYDAVLGYAIVGEMSQTTWAATDTINSYDQVSWTGVIDTITPFDWYNNPSNVRTLAHARTIISDVSSELSNINLFTNPEDFSSSWAYTGVDNSSFTLVDGPDEGSVATAYPLKSVVGATGEHYIQRNYNLTVYETLDTDSAVTFDLDTVTFDQGPANQTLTQTYTFSIFLQANGATSARIELSLDQGSQRLFFDLDLVTGVASSLFNPFGGVEGVSYGSISYGEGWFRAYITARFSYGFPTVSGRVYVKNVAGALTYTATANDSINVFGAKLNKENIDAYTSVSGQIFYSDKEYNIKKYSLDTLENYIYDALRNQLITPSPLSGFYSYFDNTIASTYNFYSIRRVIKQNFDIIRQQLLTGSYYTQVTEYNAITLPSKTYGERYIPTGISGGVNASEYFYGTFSDAYAELEKIFVNEGYVVQVYQRFRIAGDITDGPFTMNEVVTKQGAPSVTGVVYGFYEDENFKYLDVRVTAGPWAITDVIVGDENSTTAQIDGIENRLQIIDLRGDFVSDVPFKGYTSGFTATPIEFLKTQASVTDNTGGILSVDTETLLGDFETTSVIYSEASREYIDVNRFSGFDLNVGNRIASSGHIRLTVAFSPGLDVFAKGNYIYKIVAGIQDLNTYAIVTEIDYDNNYLYIAPVAGTFENNDSLGDYGLGGSFPVGQATIVSQTTVAGAGAALVQDIKDLGLTRRLYLSNITGTIDIKDYIIGPSGHKSYILNKQELKGRVKRSTRGFDGVQTNFDLTIENGTDYFPDPAGHMLIFINGILQPPGATRAYTAFSNQIQFNEAPELGASFTGFYVGKLRQLDDISFEFDSLRQSFNLKRNEVFYSLTLTEGTQSNTIRPENNIIVSLNGVIQEPGVGFEIVGSRIIFSEIPRVGSTFVAFSYVGSEADVDAAEVIPPVEPGDVIRIEGETTDREVAVIESSNSLITFDYLGSVFGQGAIAQANLTTGYIDEVTVTSGGSGYTSRPLVRLDSITGFDGRIRALVGVAGVEMSNPGSGYKNPEIQIETSVPDDWVAPNLEDYGEELVDPEIIF